MRPHVHTDAREHPAERQERLLAAAVGILTGDEDASAVSLRERLGAPEVRRIEEAIEAIAEQYRYEDRASREGGRINDAAGALMRIEAACAELAAAFDEASPDAYGVLHGYGPGGTNFRNMGWRPHSRNGSPHALRDFGTAIAVTSRYQLPIGPDRPSGEILSDVLAAGPASIAPPGGEPVHWPEAVAALGMMIGALREDFEARFRTEIERIRDIRDHGPAGTLRPSPDKAEKIKRKLSRAKPPRNAQGDVGGKQNVSHIIRGAPKWILTRECLEILDSFRGHWNPAEVEGSRSGRFFRFVLAVYGYAADEEVEERTDKGDKDYTAGLGHHIRAAVSIGPRLVELNKRIGSLSDREREERASLQQAWADGREPEWKD